MIIGFDPGRDKCGVAVKNNQGEILYHQVIDSQKAIEVLQKLCQKYHPECLVIGNQTTSKKWLSQIEENLSPSLPINLIDERNSTVEARERYWEMYPPKGLQKLIPQGLRVPPRPVDDIVAILLIERFRKTNFKKG